MFVQLGVQKFVTFDQQKNVTLTRVKDSAFIFFTYEQWKKLYELAANITSALHFGHEFSETFLHFNDGQTVRVNVYRMKTEDGGVWLCDIRLLINKIPQSLSGVALTTEQWEKFLQVLTSLEHNKPVEGQQNRLGPHTHVERFQELADCVVATKLADAIELYIKDNCFACKNKKDLQKQHTCYAELVAEDVVFRYAQKAKSYIEMSKTLSLFLIVHCLMKEEVHSPSWPFFPKVADYIMIIRRSIGNFNRIKNLAANKIQYSADETFGPMIETVLERAKALYADLDSPPALTY